MHRQPRMGHTGGRSRPPTTGGSPATSNRPAGPRWARPGPRSRSASTGRSGSSCPGCCRCPRTAARTWTAHPHGSVCCTRPGWPPATAASTPPGSTFSTLPCGRSTCAARRLDPSRSCRTSSPTWWGRLPKAWTTASRPTYGQHWPHCRISRPRRGCGGYGRWPSSTSTAASGSRPGTSCTRPSPAPTRSMTRCKAPGSGCCSRHTSARRGSRPTTAESSTSTLAGSRESTPTVSSS